MVRDSRFNFSIYQPPEPIKVPEHAAEAEPDDLEVEVEVDLDEEPIGDEPEVDA